MKRIILEQEQNIIHVPLVFGIILLLEEYDSTFHKIKSLRLKGRREE